MSASRRYHPARFPQPPRCPPVIEEMPLKEFRRPSLRRSGALAAASAAIWQDAAIGSTLYAVGDLNNDGYSEIAFAPFSCA